MDEVSSYGYAWGYIGSCIPFLIALIGYILGPDMVGLISNRMSMIIGYTVTVSGGCKIVPAERSGEYFGIYDIFAKGASFLGSMVIAGVKLAGGTINVAVATLAIFFALGFVFLKIADKQKTIRSL
ncbi:MAG: MFS transporter [Lachnospiraceae bacterium]|nr:MFS transporter [Lachnospiraceae bacterium]